MNAKSGTSGGNRLRALREYYGKTQLDVELDAHLGIGYLQRVESGKVHHPERDTLERILTALSARYTEQRDILERFGYIVDAPVPDEDEIAQAAQVCRAELDHAIFPAYLLDCKHRLLAWNALLPQIFNFDQFPRLSGTIQRFSMLKIIFDPAYHVNPHIANPDTFLPAQIRALRYEMQFFHDEQWYTDLIEEMLGCPVFEKYWRQSESAPVYHVAARPLSPLELQSSGGLLQFRLISEPFAQDRRFRVIYFLPAEPNTIQRCLNWFEQAAISH